MHQSSCLTGGGIKANGDQGACRHDLADSNRCRVPAFGKYLEKDPAGGDNAQALLEAFCSIAISERCSFYLREHLRVIEINRFLIPQRQTCIKIRDKKLGSSSPFHLRRS